MSRSQRKLAMSDIAAQSGNVDVTPQPGNVDVTAQPGNVQTAQSGNVEITPQLGIYAASRLRSCACLTTFVILSGGAKRRSRRTAQFRDIIANE